MSNTQTAEQVLIEQLKQTIEWQRRHIDDLTSQLSMSTFAKQRFNQVYYTACASSRPHDWMQAALLAKQLID